MPNKSRKKNKKAKNPALNLVKKGRVAKKVIKHKKFKLKISDREDPILKQNVQYFLRCQMLVEYQTVNKNFFAVRNLPICAFFRLIRFIITAGLGSRSR